MFQSVLINTYARRVKTPKVLPCFLGTTQSWGFNYFIDQATPPQHFGPVEAGFQNLSLILSQQAWTAPDKFHLLLLPVIQPTLFRLTFCMIYCLNPKVINPTQRHLIYVLQFRYLGPTIFQFPLPTIVHLKQFQKIFQCYYSTTIFLKNIFNSNCV